MEKKDTFRILARGEERNNNTWKTGINNNDLIIGPSGAGKTRSYVKPNIMQGNESMIVVDTKGDLQRQLTPLLKKKGYEVRCIDYKNIEQSDGYNPFDYIRYNKQKEEYEEQDIKRIAKALVLGETNSDDPFWDNSARTYITFMIAYVVEFLPVEEQHLKSVYDMLLILQQETKEEREAQNSLIIKLMNQAKAEKPNSLAVKLYNLIRGTASSDKTYRGILGVLSERFNGLIMDEQIEMYKAKNRIDFARLGEQKTVLFFHVSDTDRSMDRLVGLFYTQALQVLVEAADSNVNNRLEVPVRLILDDFATNALIPDFDKTISVIRSREIYVSIILQSISQLDGLYRKHKAMTIMNNCDNCLYLGGQDVNTAKQMGIKANKSVRSILQMPLEDTYLFTRGSLPKTVEKYDITLHPDYKELQGENREDENV